MARPQTKRVCNELLFAGFMILLSRLTEYLQPLIKRKIHPEEVWLYKNPRTPSFVGSQTNWMLCAVGAIGVFVIVYSFRKNKQDLIEAILGASFSAGFTGTITNILKNVACRPRPDFFYRCFPDGNYIEGMPDSCTGKQRVIFEGLRSFPSGHSSLAFSVFGFVSLYLAGKLQCFNTKGRQPWRLVVSALPILGATIIAISRTADYHHHWQDVLVGSCLGMAVAYLSYRQRYPPLNRPMCHLPYISLTAIGTELHTPQVVKSTQIDLTPNTESRLKIV